MKTDKDIDKLWHDIKKYEDALKRKQEELTELIDKLKPKQCDIPIVSQQRELLEGFRDFVNKNPNSQHVYNYDVSDYLKIL